jgi:hypothetical protein
LFPTSAMAEQWYQPGEEAPVSGVYVVVHAEHRLEHQATLLQGEAFASCSVCSDQVRFRITHTALAIREASDFSST